MANIPTLVLCLLAGMALRATRRAPDDAHAFIIHVALEALILGQIHGIRLRPELLLPVSMPWANADGAALHRRAVLDPRDLPRDDLRVGYGPRIGGAIVAMQCGLSTSLITLMVGVGVILSFLRLPLWYLGLAMI